MKLLYDSVPSTSSTSPTPSTKIILVRHARTTYNEQGRYQGSSDESVLTPKGHQDAYTTGLALKEYNFDAIYTSPLKRVRQTTQEILTALKDRNNVPSVYSDRLLTEIFMSHWQGLYYQEVKEKFAEAYHCWQNTPHLFSINNTYPVLELFEKAKLFWQQVLTKHQGQTILIVAHGGTNRALISTAVGLKPESYHNLQQSNCGISRLEFTSINNGELKYLNATHHLGETLPKLKAGKTGWRWLLLPETNAKSDLSLFDILGSGNINLLLTEHSIPESFAQKIATKYRIPHLPLAENHFFNWQQIIINRQKSPIFVEQSHLSTGLIIASDKLITRILKNTFQVNTFHAQDSLAVIHYPQSANHPIIQGILPLISQAILLSK
ncbi:MAG: histidine phosphatase family protein [Cyanobacteria bacterium P01_A01_bin.83]